MQLAEFQSAFVTALYGESGFALASQPGFRVYRNTVIKGCIDALLANFPTVERLTGVEWFHLAAGRFVRLHPPRQVSLLRYGEEFPRFLADHSAASGLPYLAGVAQLDFDWLAAHTAADEAALRPADLAGIPPRQLAALRLRPHATARWAWFAGAPIYTIWDANRRLQSVPARLEWRGEGALLLRPGDEVQWLRLDASACALLDACARGSTLAEALEAGAGDMNRSAAAFRALLEAGAFANIIEGENG